MTRNTQRRTRQSRRGDFQVLRLVLRTQPRSFGGGLVLAVAALLALAFLPATGAAAIDTSTLPPPLTRPVDSVKEIKPLFEASCLRCHGAEKQKSGFRLDSKEAALKGGDNYAPAIKPAHSGDSPLIHLVAGLVEDMRMPQNGELIGNCFLDAARFTVLLKIYSCHPCNPRLNFKYLWLEF